MNDGGNSVGRADLAKGLTSIEAGKKIAGKEGLGEPNPAAAGELLKANPGEKDFEAGVGDVFRGNVLGFRFGPDAKPLQFLRHGYLRMLKFHHLLNSLKIAALFPIGYGVSKRFHLQFAGMGVKLNDIFTERLFGEGAGAEHLEGLFQG